MVGCGQVSSFASVVKADCSLLGSRKLVSAIISLPPVQLSEPVEWKVLPHIGAAQPPTEKGTRVQCNRSDATQWAHGQAVS